MGRLTIDSLNEKVHHTTATYTYSYGTTYQRTCKTCKKIFYTTSTSLYAQQCWRCGGRGAAVLNARGVGL